MYICDSRAGGNSPRTEQEENKAGKDQITAKVVAEMQRAVKRCKNRWREFRPVCFLLFMSVSKMGHRQNYGRYIAITTVG